MITDLVNLSTSKFSITPAWWLIPLSLHTDTCYDLHPLTARPIWIADVLRSSRGGGGGALWGPIFPAGLQEDGASGAKVIHLYHLIQRTCY